MYCTNCGNEIDEGSNFCGFCGQKIKNNANKVEESEPKEKATDTQEVNVSAVKEEVSLKEPRFETTEVLKENVQNRETKESAEKTVNVENTNTGAKEQQYTQDIDMNTLIGKNTEYYLREFGKIERGEKAKFNLAAFFFGPIVTLYRKQFDAFKKYIILPTLLSLLALAVELIGSKSFNFALMSLGAVLSIAAGIVSLILLILLGKRFNGLYYSNLKRILAADMSRSDKLNRTGTSMKYIIIYFAVIIAMSAAVFGITFASVMSGLNSFDSDYGDYVNDGGYLSDDNYSVINGDSNNDDNSAINGDSNDDECPDLIVDMYSGEWYEVNGSRYMIEIQYQGNNCFYVTVGASSSAFDVHLWEMIAQYDRGADWLVYDNCISRTIYYDDMGEYENEWVYYTDGEGALYLEGGSLFWKDLEEYEGDGLEFYLDSY